jgi:hypothetical protein
VSETFTKVCALVAAEDFRVSDHAFRQMQNRGLIFNQLKSSVFSSEMIEDYPGFHKGPSVLELSQVEGQAVHMV